MNILGIETSCDETAAAVVTDGRQVRSSLIYSQVQLHAPHGGVVPEIAARSHLERLPGLIKAALEQAGIGWQDVNAVAATYGPGLVGALLVGFSTAKSLATRLNIPLIGINHLEAHVYSPALVPDMPTFQELCPMLVLMVSGGHTCLIRANSLGYYQMLGTTLDDAAGEALDKGAKLLGLGYPGGPAIEKAAVNGNPQAVDFPRGATHGRDGEQLTFSFSGLKTALLYHLRKYSQPLQAGEMADIAASYQEAVMDALTMRARLALRQEKIKRLAAVGGVSINQRLREKLGQLAEELGCELILAQPKYCMDNAAMVAGLAGVGGGISGAAAMALDVNPGLSILG